MSGSAPSVSVLLLSFNHAKYIKAAVESVFKQADSVDGIELIVVDDGSSDETPLILKELASDAPVEMKVHLRAHEGITSISRNLNEMISMANGKYVAFLASDDEYVAGRFISQIALMEANKSLVLVYGNGENCREGNLLGPSHSKEVVDLLSTGDPNLVYDYVTSRIPVIFIQAVLARRDFLMSVVPFDEELIADDWVFNIRTFDAIRASKKSFMFVDESLFIRNLHGSNTSRDKKSHYLRIKQVVEKYFGPSTDDVMARLLSTYVIAASRDFSFDETWFFLRQLITRRGGVSRLAKSVVEKAINKLR